MNKENIGAVKAREPPLRITRARAKALDTMGGQVQKPPRPEPHKFLRAKRLATSENNLTAPSANLQKKRRATLADVTNVLCELSHVSCFTGGKLQEWEGRINVGMSNAVTTAIRGSVRDMAIGKTKNAEKADRATVEQVIDPRTRMVLYRMLNRGVFSDINGCISTGKEANVYHATKSDGQELAIKVYKTSVLVFKGRYSVELHLSFLHLQGQANDFKIQFSSIVRLFLLQSNQPHTFVVITLDPPIRKGQNIIPTSSSLVSLLPLF